MSKEHCIWCLKYGFITHFTIWNEYCDNIVVDYSIN